MLRVDVARPGKRPKAPRRWAFPLVMLLLLTAPIASRSEETQGSCPSGDYPQGPPNDPGYENNWWLHGCLPDDSPLAQDPENASGMSVDWAWAEYTTGRPDVVYSYMEGGPNWHLDTALDFVNRTYLNRGELPVPRDDEGATGTGPDVYDLNGDGVFNVQDYAQDARVTDVNETGWLDPQDIIVTFTDSVDDDGNGYVDDISGWDFWRDDNDPATDQGYPHANNWIPAAVGEANNGRGRNVVSTGVCPDCMVMPIRVATGVLIDTDRFARALAFAADAGVSVVSISAGAMAASKAAQDAIDYAWSKGTVVVAGSHDLATSHHLFPNTGYERILVANALVADSLQPQLRTNFREWGPVGGYGLGSILIAIPDTGSYSNTSPMFGGVVGLIQSHSRDLVDDGVLSHELTPHEIKQILIAAASRVTDADHTLPDSYPAGDTDWSQFYGYGRPNLRRAMELMSAGRIPPEADITAPEQYAFIDPTLRPELPISGFVAASRAGSFGYVLEVAHGLEPHDDDFVEIVRSSGLTSSIRGTLGTWRVADVPRSAWEAPVVARHERWEAFNDFTWTLRLRVTDDEGNFAETRKTVAVHHDPAAVADFPLKLSAGGTGARLTDLDRDGQTEIVLATNDGRVHAFTLDGSELPGFPVETDPVDALTPGTQGNYLDAPAYASGALMPYPDSIAGTVAIGDIDGDGEDEIVAATLGDGVVYAWGHDGVLEAGFPVRMDPALSSYPASPLEPRPRDERTKVGTGFYAAPALADLDGEPGVEIVLPGMDHYLYLWRGDGSQMPSSPILVEDGSCALGEQAIVSSPGVADIDGDGVLEIVFGTQCRELHAMRADGTEAPGWPRQVPGSIDVFEFAMAGASAGPAIGDVHPSPGLEIGFAGWWGPSLLYDARGNVLSVFQGAPGPLTDLRNDGSILLNISATGAFGDITGDGRAEFFQAGTQAPWAFEKVAYPGSFTEVEHGMRAWDPVTGAYLPAYPRRVEDYAFFYMTPIVTDVDGNGTREVIQGTSGWLVHAFDAAGVEPAGWPKFTNGWAAPAAAGDLDDDGKVEVVQATLEGYLFAWHTDGATSQNDQWWTAGRDERGTRTWMQ